MMLLPVMQLAAAPCAISPGYFCSSNQPLWPSLSLSLPHLLPFSPAASSRVLREVETVKKRVVLQ